MKIEVYNTVKSNTRNRSNKGEKKKKIIVIGVLHLK